MPSVDEVFILLYALYQGSFQTFTGKFVPVRNYALHPEVSLTFRTYTPLYQGTYELYLANCHRGLNDGSDLRRINLWPFITCFYYVSPYNEYRAHRKSVLIAVIVYTVF